MDDCTYTLGIFHHESRLHKTRHTSLLTTIKTNAEQKSKPSTTKVGMKTCTISMDSNL